MTTTTRDELLAVIKRMPKRTSYEAAIDRLALLAELKHRLDDLDSGKVKPITHAEAKRRMKKWLG